MTQCTVHRQPLVFSIFLVIVGCLSKKRCVFSGDSRIDPFFDFFIRAEMLMSQAVCHRSKQMVFGRSNVWRVRRMGKTTHFNVSKYVLTDLATCGRALSCWRITLLCLSWYCGRSFFNTRLERINCFRYRSLVMVSLGFNSTTPSWSHQMQSITLAP